MRYLESEDSTYCAPRTLNLILFCAITFNFDEICFMVSELIGCLLLLEICVLLYHITLTYVKVSTPGTHNGSNGKSRDQSLM